MAFTAKGNVTKASWGIGASHRNAPVTGIVTDYSERSEAMLGTQQNEVGAVVQQTRYDVKKTVSVTVQVKSGVKVPEAGDQISIGSERGYVVSAELVENNMSYARISITMETYAACKQTTDAQ